MRASEVAAMCAVGGNAVLLDEWLRQTDTERAGVCLVRFRGNRYPTYDIASSDIIASVKTHYGAGGSFGEKHLKSYVTDFGKMLGFNRSYAKGLSPIRQDAEVILNLRQFASLPLPEEVRTGNAADIAAYLAERSVLLVPDNQVKPVLDQLGRVYSEMSRAALSVRVGSIGLTTFELESIVAL